MNRLQHAGAVAALAAFLVGCQTTPPPNADLTAAQAAVSAAAGDPETARLAAVEVGRAQQALRRAETAWADRRDDRETQHLAYVAQRRAAIAQAVAEQGRADTRVQLAGEERERLRAEARTREAAAAQARAQAAQRQAEQARQQAAQQAERAAALERDLQQLQGRATQRGLVVTLGDVLFATGRATLQPGAQRNAQRLADVLNRHPERRVLIEGFTDSVGGEASNQALSQRRAEAFRQALVQAGVAPERIEARGLGEAYPVADNSTPAGRQQNRRVEVIFSDAQGRVIAR